jgi:hypothetical protein
MLSAITLISLEVMLVYHRIETPYDNIPNVDVLLFKNEGGEDYHDHYDQKQRRQQHYTTNKKQRATENSTQSTGTPPRQKPPSSTTKPDGFLNGYPIYYHDLESSSLKQQQQQQQQQYIWSQMHCIGETFADPVFWKRKRQYQNLNWMSRSCHFQFLCLDTRYNDFVVFFPPIDNSGVPPTKGTPQQRQQQQQHHYHSATVYTNSTSNEGVSIGGVNAKWGNEGIARLQWFPRVSHEPPTRFYTLPSNVTLIPFHSLAAFNPGHLVWDDFLPIFTLLQIFGFVHQQPVRREDEQTTFTTSIPTLTSDLLLLRYILPGKEGQWAGCDWRDDRKEDCRHMLHKFGPLMITHQPALPITTQHSLRLEQQQNKSHYICARHALAGIGSLTDHGTNRGHGWDSKDYTTVYNAGRGGQLWRFRNFMLRNLGLVDPTATTRSGRAMANDEPPPKPFLILFSQSSSVSPSRNLDFGLYVQALNESLIVASKNVQIKSVSMKTFSLREQAEMVRQAAIYVTVCGGGAVSATFLPRGASMIVFFNEMGGVEGNRPSGKPARLDWDYLNNMAYARVHWLTKTNKPAQEDLQVFVRLVEHELELMEVQLEKWEKEGKSSPL